MLSVRETYHLLGVSFAQSHIREKERKMTKIELIRFARRALTGQRVTIRAEVRDAKTDALYRKIEGSISHGRLRMWGVQII